MEFDVAIVIVTFNSERMIGDLLDSLPAALDGLRADVVVVDNGSSDGTAAVVEARSDCRLIRSENRGYSAGINVGKAAAARAEAVYVLNPDMRLRPASVLPLLEEVRRPGIGIAAPKVEDADGRLSYSLRRDPTPLRAMGLNWTRRPMFSEYLNKPEDYLSRRLVDWALGAALMVSRDCWDAVGDWDESFFLYSEETDYCLRARDLGFATAFVPDAVVCHIGGGSGQSGATHAMQILNRVRFYARRHSAPAAWLYYALTILSELSWVARGSKPARASLPALVRPGRRPEQLGLRGALLPR